MKEHLNEIVVLPLVNGLLVLFVGFDEPFSDAYETAVHQTALQQVVNGLEEKSSTFVGQTAFPHTVILACGEDTQRPGHQPAADYKHHTYLLYGKAICRSG